MDVAATTPPTPHPPGILTVTSTTNRQYVMVPLLSLLPTPQTTPSPAPSSSTSITPRTAPNSSQIAGPTTPPKDISHYPRLLPHPAP
ncbi:MAG: hypothetical protein U1U88_001836 [Lawsonella clevelandensis]